MRWTKAWKPTNARNTVKAVIIHTQQEAETPRQEHAALETLGSGRPQKCIAGGVALLKHSTAKIGGQTGSTFGVEVHRCSDHRSAADRRIEVGWLDRFYRSNSTDAFRNIRCLLNKHALCVDNWSKLLMEFSIRICDICCIYRHSSGQLLQKEKRTEKIELMP